MAVSDATATLASPWKTVDGKGPAHEVAARLVALLGKLASEEDGLDRVVVGLPVHLDGQPHDEAARTREIAGVLERRLRVPVTLQDERLTSIEAEQRLAERERDWRKRKQRLDAAAAAVILQEYLDGRGHEEGRG